MAKICTVGSATQDIFILTEGAETMHLQLKNGPRSFLLFEQGTKIDVPSIHYAIGGGATNTAVGFSRIGHQAEAYFCVGNDPAGQTVQQQMVKESVSIEHVAKLEGTTGTSFIIPSIEKNHVVFAHRGVNQQLSTKNFPLHLFQKLDYIYACPLSGAGKDLLLFLALEAKKHTIPLVANPGMSQIGHEPEAFLAQLPSIDYLILNAYEAASLLQAEHNPQAIPDHAQALLKKGPSIVVITNGAEGVYVATKSGLYFHPSVHTKPVSGLGAGDAFGSGFIGALALKKTLEEAIIFGILNATSVIEHLDAQEGLLTLDELEKRADALGMGQLEKYSF